MNSLTLVLIVVGTILGLLLIVVVYTIRKYLIQRKQLDGDGHDMKADYRHFSTTSSGSGFEVPITTRAVKRQFGTPDCYGGFNSEITRAGAIKDNRTGIIKDQHHRGSLPDLSYARNSPRTSITSIGEKEDRLVESILPVHIQKDKDLYAPKFDKTQRRISHSMLNILAIQGKQGSNAIRSSLTEEMFIKDLEQNTGNFLATQTSLDDGSSVHSLPEFVDSPALGGQKRRVIDRRIRKGNENTPLKRTYKKSGKIKFTTRFFHDKRMLELHIHKAYDLAPKKDAGELNTFVRVYLVPGKRQKKETQNVKGREPFFNEKIEFVDMEEDSLSKYRMKLKVYNKVRMKKNELLGEVDIALSSIDIRAKETFNPDLFLQRSESSLATVTVLINHQATFNKLEVTLQKANNLPRLGMTGLPNSYATVQLFKEQSIDKKDTAIKKGTKDPVFNEMLEFDVETDSGRPLSRYSLVVSLNHKPGVVGKEEVLGHVIFSVTSPQKSAADHWKFVSETPHKHFELSHSLVDPDELCFNSNRMTANQFL